jgi:hypothetical protein
VYLPTFLGYVDTPVILIGQGVYGMLISLFINMEVDTVKTRHFAGFCDINITT